MVQQQQAKRTHLSRHCRSVLASRHHHLRFACKTTKTTLDISAQRCVRVCELFNRKTRKLEYVTSTKIGTKRVGGKAKANNSRIMIIMEMVMPTATTIVYQEWKHCYPVTHKHTYWVNNSTTTYSDRSLNWNNLPVPEFRTVKLSKGDR